MLLGSGSTPMGAQHFNDIGIGCLEAEITEEEGGRRRLLLSVEDFLGRLRMRFGHRSIVTGTASYFGSTREIVTW
jgi:hypothetical protein